MVVVEGRSLPRKSEKSVKIGKKNGQKQAYHGGKNSGCAEAAESEDVVCALLDVHTLSFLKNGRLLGVARTLPPGKELFPCVATNECGQSVITLAVDPEANSDSKL